MLKLPRLLFEAAKEADTSDPIYIVFPWPSCNARGPGQGATVFQCQCQTTKNWRGFVDKTKARLAPGNVKLYNEVVFSNKVDLYINR